MNLETKLKEIVLADKRLMEILHAARELDLPDWFIAGGAIRNSVWDVLCDFKEHTELNDVDLVYFDKNNLSDKRDKELGQLLKRKLPRFNWEVENQAKYEPKGEVFAKTEDGIARWIETPTATGARLEKDGSITICAPFGLEDLFNGHARINPKFPQPEYFRQRMAKKRWDKMWPIVKYLG